MSKKPTHVPLQKYDLTQATPQQADAILEHLARHALGLYNADPVNDDQVAQVTQALVAQKKSVAPAVAALFSLAYSDNVLDAAHVEALEKENNRQTLAPKGTVRASDKPLAAGLTDAERIAAIPNAEWAQALHMASAAVMQPGRTHLRETRAGMRPSQGRITFPDLREATPEQAQRILDMCCHELNIGQFSSQKMKDKYDELAKYFSTQTNSLDAVIIVLHRIAEPGLPYRQQKSGEQDPDVILANAENKIRYNIGDCDNCSAMAATALMKAVFGVMKPAVQLERVGVVLE